MIEENQERIEEAVTTMTKFEVMRQLTASMDPPEQSDLNEYKKVVREYLAKELSAQKQKKHYFLLFSREKGYITFFSGVTGDKIAVSFFNIINQKQFVDSYGILKLIENKDEYLEVWTQNAHFLFFFADSFLVPEGWSE